MAETIVIAGSLAQKPECGGHSWVFLQYLLGFKRLGWDVLFLDRLEPEMCVDASGRPCAIERSLNLQYFLRVMNRFDLMGSSALICNPGGHTIGLSRRQVLERIRNSAFLLNVAGYLTDEQILERAARRVFLDIDPGFTQMWHELRLHDGFRGHDTYVTIAGNIGRPGCLIPTCGLDWITTPPPVVLDYWDAAPRAAGALFTSVGSWRGAYGPVEFQGRTYGLRVHEFRKFAHLPLRSGRSFHLALNIHCDERADIALLSNNKWLLLDPKAVAGDPCAYREFIRGSKAEFTVAKGMYAQTDSGWFSDRSACYLASARPVLAQDTGFTRLYPTGEGLLAFTTFEEALSGIEELSLNYERHSSAARALAEEYFDSDKVLSRLLMKTGLA